MCYRINLCGVIRFQAPGICFNIHGCSVYKNRAITKNVTELSKVAAFLFLSIMLMFDIHMAVDEYFDFKMGSVS